MVEIQHLVLFPNGQPATAENRDYCTALLISCGADLQRFLDGPWSSEEQFVRYVSRIDDVVSGLASPFVVLTRTSPLALAVVAKRRRLCEALVNLRRALWVIFVDPNEEPFFFDNAENMGSFDMRGDIESDVRVWAPENGVTGQAPERYLVLTPRTACDDFLKIRTATLWKEAESNPLEVVTSSRLRAVQVENEPQRPFSRRRNN